MAQRSLSISRRLNNQPPQQRSGFTLIELLLVTVLGSVVLLGAAFFAVSGIRTTAGLRIAQRYQTGFGRLSHLIETEVSEASRGVNPFVPAVRYVQPVAGCQGGVNSVFTLRIPILPRGVDPQDATPQIGTVHYYQNGQDLWRCGPRVRDDGTLIPDTLVSGLLLVNSELQTRNETFDDFEYQVVMRDANNATAVFDSSVDPGWLRVRTRPFQISSDPPP